MNELSMNGSQEQQFARAARFATSAIFFVNGAVFGNWVARIPAVRRSIELSEGQLGLALLGVAVGALLAMPLTGWLVASIGSRRIITISALGFCATLPVLALAFNLPTLALALVLFGINAGALDVSMNVQGVVVERQYRRPIMSSLHALFSVGGMAGAAAGGVAASFGLDPLPHFVGAGVLLGVLTVIVSRMLLPVDVGVVSQGPAFARPTGPLIALGAVAFCVALSEGAVADWSAVYLRETLRTGPGMAAAGFSAFSLAMAIGRLLGDRFIQAYGPGMLVRAGSIVAAVGLTLSLLIGHPIAGIAGFAAVGAGLSIVFPVALSSAGRTPGMPPSVAIAAVSTIGYTGFLIGPPLIGFTAELSSLRWALGVLVLLSALVGGLSSAVNHGSDNQDSDS